MLDKALQDASAIENRMSNLELTVKNLQSRLLERLDLAWEKLAKLEAMAQAAQEQHDKVRLTSKQHEQIHQLRTAQRAAPCRRRARGFK